MKTVKFKKWICTIHIHHYLNGRPAIQLRSADKLDPGPVLTATVNLPEIPIETDEVIIKDYSENEGILEVLIEAGIISEPNWTIKSDHVTFPVCRLL
jgi:hypothetical protein